MKRLGSDGFENGGLFPATKFNGVGGWRARTSGLCGLSAAGEHSSECTMMRVESSASENTSATLPNLAI